MSRSHSRTLVLLGFASAILFSLTTILTAQEAVADSKQKKVRQGRRLPAHYAKVVSPLQRDEIYKIQSAHAKTIKALRDELKAAVALRDQEVRKVLSPEQQTKLDELFAAAKAKRAADRKRRAQEAAAAQASAQTTQDSE